MASEKWCMTYLVLQNSSSSARNKNILNWRRTLYPISVEHRWCFTILLVFFPRPWGRCHGNVHRVELSHFCTNGFSVRCRTPPKNLRRCAATPICIIGAKKKTAQRLSQLLPCTSAQIQPDPNHSPNPNSNPNHLDVSGSAGVVPPLRRVFRRRFSQNNQRADRQASTNQTHGVQSFVVFTPTMQTGVVLP